nr:hypothetical protein [uncultured Holophaga sp.]
MRLPKPLTLLLLSLGFLVPAMASGPVAQDQGRIVYPRAMAHCPDCRRAWLRAQLKVLAEHPEELPLKPGKDGGQIVFPREIAHCPPCMRLWLSNHIEEPEADAPAQAEAAPKPESEPVPDPAQDRGDGIPRTSEGKIIYPREIRGCEPCKRLWLAQQLSKGKVK